MREGIYELHWNRGDWGSLTLRLLAREPNGQLRLVDGFDEAPFEGPGEAGVWLARALHRDLLLRTP